MADGFDWAAASLELFRMESADIRELVDAAGLDAPGGDLADIDFSGINLSDQDLSGWDLRFASLKKAKISNANLCGSQVAPEALIEATDWREAKLDADLREAAEEIDLFLTPLTAVQMDNRSLNLLHKAGYVTVGDILKTGNLDLLRIQQFGRNRLTELRLQVVQFALKRARKIFDASHVELGDIDVAHPSSSKINFVIHHGTKVTQDTKSDFVVKKTGVNNEHFYESGIDSGSVRLRFVTPKEMTEEDLKHAVHPLVLKFAGFDAKSLDRRKIQIKTE